MLLKGWSVAVGTFSAVASALYTDPETGHQPGMVNLCRFPFKF